MNDPTLEMFKAARGLIRDATWTFAKTMADNPHWYIVGHREDVRYDALLTLIHQRGVYRRWHGQHYLMLTIDGWDYWPISPVINRKPTQFAGWDGSPRHNDWLPEPLRRNHLGDDPLYRMDT